jgi:hypothetical protein
MCIIGFVMGLHVAEALIKEYYVGNAMHFSFLKVFLPIKQGLCLKNDPRDLK